MLSAGSALSVVVRADLAPVWFVSDHHPPRLDRAFEIRRARTWAGFWLFLRGSHGFGQLGRRTLCHPGPSLASGRGCGASWAWVCPAVGSDELALLPMYHTRQQRPSSHPTPSLPIRSLQHQPLHWALNSPPDPSLHILSTSLLFPSHNLQGRCYSLLFPFSASETDAQRGKATCPRSHCSSELRLESCSSGSGTWVLPTYSPRTPSLGLPAALAPADHPRPCSVSLSARYQALSSRVRLGGPSVMAYQQLLKLCLILYRCAFVGQGVSVSFVGFPKQTGIRRLWPTHPMSQRSKLSPRAGLQFDRGPRVDGVDGFLDLRA